MRWATVPAGRTRPAGARSAASAASHPVRTRRIRPRIDRRTVPPASVTVAGVSTVSRARPPAGSAGFPGRPASAGRPVPPCGPSALYRHPYLMSGRATRPHPASDDHLRTSCRGAPPALWHCSAGRRGEERHAPSGNYSGAVPSRRQAFKPLRLSHGDPVNGKVDLCELRTIVGGLLRADSGRERGAEERLRTPGQGPS